MKKKRHSIWYLLIVILLVRLGLNFFFPQADLDGPWSLSHTFSIINGNFFRSSFAHDFFGFYNLPYVYGFVTAILYFPFAHTDFNIYSIFIINTALIVFLICLCRLLFLKSENYNSPVFKFFCLAIVLSTATYLERPELINICFIFLFHMLLIKINRKNKTFLIVIAGILLTVIGLCHPTGGIYAITFFTLFCMENKWKISRWLLVAVASFTSFIIFYAPIILIDTSAWYKNFFTYFVTNQVRKVGFSTFFRFFPYAIPLIPLIVFYFFEIPRRRIIYELIIFFIVIICLMLFGRYYYYFYLFHFFCWRWSSLKEIYLAKWETYVISLFCIIGAFLCLIVPLAQVIENKSYAITFKKILLKEREIALKNPNKKVWVSPQMGMSVIDQENGRLHFDKYVEIGKAKPMLDNDIFLIENIKMYDYIKKFADNTKDTLVIKNIIPPVKGLFRSSYKKLRSGNLGLWQISVERK